MNNDRRYTLICFGSGVIFGCFLANILFHLYGVNGLWFLSILGVCLFILGFVYYFQRSNNLSEFEKKQQAKAKDQNKKPTLVDRARKIF